MLTLLSHDGKLDNWSHYRLCIVENPCFTWPKKHWPREQSSPTEVIKKIPRVVYVSIEDEIRAIDPELRTFFNANTKQDVARAERILSQNPED